MDEEKTMIRTYSIQLKSIESAITDITYDFYKNYGIAIKTIAVDFTIRRSFMTITVTG